jgi:hypothetical protein
MYSIIAKFYYFFFQRKTLTGNNCHPVPQQFENQISSLNEGKKLYRSMAVNGLVDSRYRYYGKRPD